MELQMSSLPARIGALFIMGALLASPAKSENGTSADEMARQHFSFAVQNKKGGDLKEAVAQYEKSLSYDNTIFQVHYSYADLLLEMGKKEQARRHYLTSYNPEPGSLQFCGYAEQTVLRSGNIRFIACHV